jgi:hypothetical protein
METAWDRIDEAFRTWIESTGSTAEEYNATSIVDRGTLRTQFGQQQQQQPNGKLRCCFCILVFKCCFEYETNSIYTLYI